MDYVFTLSDTIKENNELFVVVESPFEQLTLRLGYKNELT